MKNYILVAVMLAIVFFVIAKKQSSKEKAKPTTKNPEEASEEPVERVWPFYSKPVISQPEQILYFRILGALPEYIVFSQVQLSRFLGVKKGNNFNAWNNRINRMSVDFLICRKDASVIAAVELDDSTHSFEGRPEADAKKNKALADAGIKLIRWHVKNIPSIKEIKIVFDSHLELSGDLAAQDSSITPARS